MAFCTKCGQQLVEGEVHVCPAMQNGGAKPQNPSDSQQRQNNQFGTNPNPQQQFPNQGQQFQQTGAHAEGQQGKAFSVNSDDSTIGVSINTDMVKDKYNNVKTKLTQNNSAAPVSATDAFERGKKIVPECIVANDGEIPIKQYNIAKLRTRIILATAEGRLQVTNKRVIFRATGRSIFGRVSLHEEFKINELAGVEMRNRPEFNIFNFFAALLVFALCAAPGVGISSEIDNGFFRFFVGLLGVLAIATWIFLAVIFHNANSFKRYYTPRLAVLGLVGGLIAPQAGIEVVSGYLGDRGATGKILMAIECIILLLALINVFLLMFVPNLVIKVKTKGSFPGIEVVKEQPFALLSFLFGKTRDDSSGFLEVLAWTDTDLAARELGTMLDDIQTLGDAAIEKWKED